MLYNHYFFFLTQFDWRQENMNLQSKLQSWVPVHRIFIFNQSFLGFMTWFLFINIFGVLNIHWASVMQLEITFIISVWIRCVDNFKIHCSTFVFADMKSRLTQMILWLIKTSRTGFTAAMTQWQINYYRDTQTCPNSLCQRTRQSPHSTSEI